MRTFARLFLLDMREGVFTAGPCIAIVFALQFMNALLLDPLARDFAFSLEDMVLYVLGGVKEYRPDEMTRFVFPVTWMLTCLLMLFATLAYPLRDMRDFSCNVLLCAGSRRAWWLAKCSWVVVCAFSFAIAGAAGAAAGCVLCGGDPFGGLHEEMFRLVVVDASRVVPDPGGLGSFFVAAVCMAAALSVAQLSASLLLRPVFAYAACAALLFFTVFVSTGVNPGEYLMAVRCADIIQGGAGFGIGVAYAAVVLLASAGAGTLLFSKFDLTGKDSGL